MRLKPKYFIIFAIVAFIVALIPWIDGYVFKIKYLATLAKISRDNGVKIDVVSYHLGWLSSKAQINANFTPGNPATALTIDQQITHGPLLTDPISQKLVHSAAAIQSVLHLAPKIETVLLGAAASQGIMQVATLATFHGNFTNQFTVTSFSVSPSDQQKMMTQGLKGIVDVEFPAQNVRHISTQMNAGVMSIQNSLGTVSLKGFSSSGDKTCPASSLCNGTSKTSIPEGEVTGVNDVDIKVSKFNILTTYSVDDHSHYNGYLQTTLDKWTAPTYALGPINLQFWLNDINASALMKVFDFIKQAKNKLSTGAVTEQKGFVDELDNILPQLLTPTTVLNSEFKMATSFGDVSSVSKLSLLDSAVPPTNLMAIFQKVSYQANVRAATSLVDQLIKLIDDNQIAFNLPGIPSDLVEAEAPVKSDIQSEIKNWVDQQKISDDTGKQILQLQSQKLASEIYSLAMDKFVANGMMTDDIATTLKDQYDASNKSSELAVGADADNSSAPTAPTTAEKPAESKPAIGMMKAQFDALLKLGYVVHEKNDYVTFVDYEKGALKINNIAYPPPPSAPRPASTPPIAPPAGAEPPAVTSAATIPPATAPSAVTLPVTTPPAVSPPTVTPPAITPSVATPPAASTPPVSIHSQSAVQSAPASATPGSSVSPPAMQSQNATAAATSAPAAAIAPASASPPR